LNERMEKATAASSDASQIQKRLALQYELRLVDDMREIGEAGRYDPDPRIDKIVDWIAENMCPGLRAENGTSPKWNDRRVLIFTEYEDTRQYLERCLREAIAHTDNADVRIATFTGMTSSQRREEIKHAFNTEPRDHPLRILIATDAAREGLNLQRHCHDLFHFDLPWNPSRLDQRNGRVDRKLQPSEEVFCHYFVYTQRPEDRVLKVLVKKAERIREELGSVAKVLEGRIAETIGKEGMRRNNLDELADSIQNETADVRQTIADEELEDARLRQNNLKDEVDRLRNRLEQSQRYIGITAPQFRQTLSMSLKLNEAPGIVEIDPNRDRDPDTPPTYNFPATSDSLARDTGWTAALDTLRQRKQYGETYGEWRRRASYRPVVFDDPGRLGENAVQLHLEHRVAQRLLARFTAQGLIHHDLSKACLTATADAIPRVILLGRLGLYGPGAARLHEEIVPVTARWIEPGQRRGPLSPYGQTGEQTTLNSLQTALDEAGRNSIPEQVQTRLAASTQADIVDLLPHLENRAGELLRRAERRLVERAEVESQSMIELLKRQRRRIAAVAQADDRQTKFDFNPAERRQHEADRRAWERRLAKINEELKAEPSRIKDTYTVRVHRIEPLGIVYLWPRTG
ncbi:MAG: helicase-related protein, partial [Gemmatimonadota bacterium]|nr:helicase-related protein [Gemmatimonadota bacterium]